MLHSYDPDLPCYREKFAGWNGSAVPPGECHETFNRRKTGEAGLFAITTYGSSTFGALLQHAPEPDVHPPGSEISTEPELGTSLPMNDIDSQIDRRTSVENNRDAFHKRAPGVPSARL